MLFSEPFRCLIECLNRPDNPQYRVRWPVTSHVLLATVICPATLGVPVRARLFRGGLVRWSSHPLTAVAHSNRVDDGGRSSNGMAGATLCETRVHGPGGS